MMARVIALLLKDLRQLATSGTTLVLALVMPLGITTLVFLAFGNAGENGIQVPVTRVALVNQDRPLAEAGDLAVGKTIADLITSEALADLFAVEQLDDPGAARRRVEAQEADVALILPPELTRSLFEPQARLRVTVLHDPTKVTGPGVIRELVAQVLDGFAGGRVADRVALDAAREAGQPLTPEQRGRVARAYGEWAAGIGQVAMAQSGHPGVVSVDPSTQEQSGPATGVVAAIMVGMMLFFAFMIGVNGSLGLLKEHEEGTLARLRSTPTTMGTVLAGKLGAVAVVLVIQLTLLMISASLLFGVDWGDPTALIPVTLTVVVAAAGMGAFAASLVKSTTQAGPVMGGLMTGTAMLGGLYSTGFPSLPEGFKLANLLVPQGWALRGMQAVQGGAGLSEVWWIALALLIYGGALFVAGAALLRRRFA